MRTVIQELDDTYDIDDGVVFTKDSLKGSRGGEKSPLDARKMVRDAVDDGSFKTAPEVKTNCVRVSYDDGPHVDIPVYRSLDDWLGYTFYELASAEWKKSDPDGVNEWFKSWLKRKQGSGQKYSRELIRLLKSFCKNRQSYSLPSGFAITVLVEECYTFAHERLDLGLRHIIREDYNRLRSNLWIQHPVVAGEWLIDSESEHKTRNLRDLLETATNDLDELDLPNCTRSRALNVWKKVLNTDFFDERIAEAEEEERVMSKTAVAVLASSAKPWAQQT